MSAPPNLASLVPLLGRLGDAARNVILPRYRNITFEDKLDLTPVTEADREAESAIRTIIESERPHDGIWGEEHGQKNIDAEFCWVIDPIDGTKAFLRGMPVFVTLIGLLHKGKPVLGLIDQPVLNERWIGGAGVPATMNGKQIRTRRCPGIANAVMNNTDPSLIRKLDALPTEKLGSACKYASAGGDGYAYALLALGTIDVIADAGLKLHDFAALVPVIEAAGGCIRDWQGKFLDSQSDGHVLALGDVSLLQDAVKLLA